MPVDPASSVLVERPYAPPTLTPLGTLADLTRGSGGSLQTDALGDESGDVGSI